MKKQNAEEFELNKERKTNWQMPIEIGQYNTSSYLTKSEKEEIKLVATNPIRERSHLILERLILPVKDLQNALGFRDDLRKALIKLLIIETNKRKVAFWGWSKEDWSQIIAKNDSEFVKKYNYTNSVRRHIVIFVYLLFGFENYQSGKMISNPVVFANSVFGKKNTEEAINKITKVFIELGYGTGRKKRLGGVICQILLANRSPYLSDLTLEFLELLQQKEGVPDYFRTDLLPVSYVLVNLGVINQPLKRPLARGERSKTIRNISPEWLEWCKKWHDTKTTEPASRKDVYYYLIKIGRWLYQKHPSVTKPEQWTMNLAIKLIADVNEMKIGDYVEEYKSIYHLVGKPHSPRSKRQMVGALRVFLRDCQEWEWIPRNFDPTRVLATPRSWNALVKPDPRTIADDIWAKLLWAGLNLKEEDCANNQYADDGEYTSYYPVDMIRAITLTWLFAGIRSNEISRLKVGCIRWQKDDLIIPGTNEIVPKDAVCYLEIPVNKTSPGYTKPVDRVLGEAIEEWERYRPEQAPLIDKKDGGFSSFLFSYRGRKTGRYYVNKSLIPMLCRKAGVPTKDARGNITSHRARSTIATQLATSKDPMTLFELKEWLGHSEISSTINYAKVTPTKLAKSYQDAEYFKRNLRTVEVLIDQDAIATGAATNGESWKYYDLGHGLCTYDFFSQCKHRMACAGCGFYVPKGSSKAQIIEAKDNLERMLQEIPLTEEEEFAVTEGIEALTKLKEKLADVPTPDGKTPKQIEEEKESA